MEDGRMTWGLAQSSMLMTRRLPRKRAAFRSSMPLTRRLPRKPAVSHSSMPLTRRLPRKPAVSHSSMPPTPRSPRKRAASQSRMPLTRRLPRKRGTSQSSMPLTHRLPRKRAARALAALAAVTALASACQPSPGTDDAASENIPGWQWTDEQVLETVNAVRAGRSLQPESWPGGARVAVLLSFDVDNETVLGLRYGDATVGSLSQGQFGARVALPRVVDLLDREGIPASFFVPAVSLVLDPSQIDIIQAAGHHEFAIHGWIHELNSSLEADVERALLQRAVDYMTEVTGTRPLGYRAPSWNFSPNTLGILLEMGFLYDSSLMADDRPYEINAHGEPTGMIELPVEWILDDAPLFNPLGTRYSPPRDVLQVWKDEFDGAYAEGTMFVLTMHPHVIGHRSRIVVLDELIQYIKGHEDVWFGTHLEAAQWVKEQAGM